MSYTKPAEIRSMLKTEFARNAFDELNALGPRWVYYPAGSISTKEYLAPSIEEILGGVIGGIEGVGGSGDPDEIIVRSVKSLKERLTQTGHEALINWKDRYSYDAQTDKFTLRPS